VKLKKIISAVIFLSFIFSSSVFAHPGRTDSNGGHNCSEKSKAKGLCSGYHYHNGGGSSRSSNKSSSSSSSNITSPSYSTPKYTQPIEEIPEGYIKVNMPSFNVYVNDQKISNSTSKYPIFEYKNIAYFPMTWNYTQALGLETKWDDEVGFVIRRTDNKAGILNEDIGTNPSKLYAKYPEFNVFVNDNWVDNSKEEYPILVLNDITYFPMTWKFAVEELGLTINFDEFKGFFISK
jgi:hypothetical protein